MLGFAGQKLVSIIGVLAGIYLLLVILLLVFQSKFLFFPSKGLDYTPELFGMSYEDIFFKASDSTELHGWFIPAAEPAGTLLFCHGNAGNISHRIESVKIFHDLDLNVFIFDYRGYGKSGGKISENGT
ncbi:MAG: alpha/beta hydrolase, partial [bacterium]|nr:alpha/beta hydrolase [bacterium]